MTQKGLAPIFIIILIVIGIIIALPFPYYQGNVLCLPGISCPREGWYFGDPLWKKVFNYFVDINRPTQYLVKTTSPSPIPAASPISTDTGETTDWKTYTNKDAKFSIKYPIGWKIVTKGSLEVDGITISLGPNTSGAPEDTNTKVGISVLIPNHNTVISSAKDVVKVGNPPPAVLPKVEVITFHGLTAYKKTEEGASDLISFDEDGLVYSIITFHRNVDNIDPKVYDQILSTFEFTDQGVQPCGSAVGQCKSGYHCIPNPSSNNTHVGDAPGICVKN